MAQELYQKKIWKTREVMVGGVGVGGNNPVRIQSMTTSNTRDVAGTIEQIIRLADVGCEIARVTVQGMKEADACEGIKNGLIQKGYKIPLVAGIHFYPPAALCVADFADKVRINPGNFVDKRAMFKVIEYDNKSYEDELKRLEEKFTPLVEKCKKLKKAMRIGTNHGSLSDRIMNRYGDTAQGMVESALEFTRVARKLDYHDIIFSMKASNTQVMIQAYRLLVAEMLDLGWDYPLHLGVTEAGEGEDGRVKSAIGIGSLLLDGIGDTIRVSLTEDPWFEIDPCKRLAPLKAERTIIRTLPFQKREVSFSDSLHRDGSVVLKVTREEIEAESFYQDLGFKTVFGRPMKTPGSCDLLIVPKDLTHHPKLDKLAAFVGILTEPFIVKKWDDHIIQEKSEAVFFAPEENFVEETRAFFKAMAEKAVKCPVILQFQYECQAEDLVIHASSELGGLLCDGLGEGICLDAFIPLAKRRELALAILQGSRMRSFKTEFISCPGCGRTLFDLQKVAAKIRQKTAHLPGVKIAIMGCIVNGPGEMADADFGYVGSKPGKIDLYVGKTCVERDIDMGNAEEKLVDLIKAHGRWKEPDENELAEVL